MLASLALGMEFAEGAVETAQAWFFPLSLALFCLYPIGLLLWTYLVGSKSLEHASPAIVEKTFRLDHVEFEKPAKVCWAAKSPGRPWLPSCRLRELRAASGVCCALLLAVGGRALTGFATLRQSALQHGTAAQLRGTGVSSATAASLDGDVPPPAAAIPALAFWVVGVAPLVAGALCGDASIRRRAVSSRPAQRDTDSSARAVPPATVIALESTSLALEEDEEQDEIDYVEQAQEDLNDELPKCSCDESDNNSLLELDDVPRFSAPPAEGPSKWHHVSLHVQTWLDDETDVFRYVNEIPKGALQKFEMQTTDPDNIIRETEKDSAKLRAFGKPVPFNYGCFPQTWRDPEEVCELSGAIGDNDQLDVVDLCFETVSVGEIAHCRPVGAVCLIDEGQADWKILVVNTDSESALASARSVDDVERIAPGRVQQVLKWIDDLKQHGKAKGTKPLDFRVHSAEKAKDLIQGDHASWKRLVAEVRPDGFSREHWIRHPVPEPAVLESPTDHVPHFTAPAAEGPSKWHHVDLQAKDWLDEETGVLRYVNEIPMGALQKFEMQTADPDNIIRETEKDSAKLEAFGKPVPFNYGCFPQTWRDPEEICETSGAIGDNDQLDVVDLCLETVGVGEVTHCRPVGAVCLIDEGQADWKILVVNTDSDSLLADARTVEDVERVAPGRVNQVLKWIDDLKQHGKAKGTKPLDFKVHSAEKAMDIVQGDHASWKRLVADVGTDGFSRGHWIRHPEPEPAVLELPTDHVPHFTAPVAEGPSKWHHVDLHAKTWLDEDTGVFRYVNEIPMGALQKFEMQTTDPDNVIRETEKDSAKLRAFGKPVPFNYGCFPQTWRDPKEICEISGAIGDNDQLDVVDLCLETVAVGEVANCRPVGAVCLIDEGQADWKILVVNTDSNSPLADACTVEDVERIAPGRVNQVLKWIDDLKQHGKAEGTQPLDFKVHSAERAIEIINGDHQSWKRLVADVGPDGFSQGHWISHPKSEAAHTQALRYIGAVSHVPRAMYLEDLSNVPRFSAPPMQGLSMWHHVGLRAKTWLNEDTEMFRYINEIPKGALQKFEMQTTDPGNTIRETEKDSAKLRAFGKPVPFNYGCFPQTWRDPEEICELSGAIGDNDQLDVVDLGMETVPVGEVVHCRPVGAVCLIDEGQADWKILVVNADSDSLLASARTVDDVERIAPGRVNEVLKWIDDLKQHGKAEGTEKLDFKVHSAETAVKIIGGDHVAWQRLVATAGADGFSCGHWIRPSEAESKASPQVVTLTWPPRCAVPGQLLRSSSTLVCAPQAAPMVQATARVRCGITTRKQAPSVVSPTTRAGVDDLV